MSWEQALVQFIGHPTFLGGFVLLVASAVYGLVRGTAAMTRAAVAAEGMKTEMVGIRADLATTREASRAEHEQTRDEVQSLREEVLRGGIPGPIRARASRPQ